jgi:hypothetical protein
VDLVRRWKRDRPAELLASREAKKRRPYDLELPSRLERRKSISVSSSEL